MIKQQPKMMTIRQVAATGVLSEYTLRLLAKQGRLPCIYSGRRCLINYNALLAQLDGLGGLDNSNVREEVSDNGDGDRR
jgi:hypothetical protein